MTHEHFMARCLELARMGNGHVAPNPMVGSVVVHEGKIIGEGYHQKFGKAHAEVNAINNVQDKSLLKSSTIYVNLEPCSHWGKTPPCADLIIQSEIPRVVIGTVDTFAKVSGLGIRNMKLAGCEVIEGVLEKECKELNKRFFSFHNKSRPYVILKWAQSKDGFMDIDRTAGEKGTFWITQPETKVLVHKWRSEESAIMVGANTVLNDNPELTVREVEGLSPTRFIVDPENKVDLSLLKIGKEPPVTHKIAASKPEDILQEMRNKEMLSVIIEGGKFTLEQFLSANLWDEIRVITGDVELNKGLASPKVKSEPHSSYYYGKDLIETYYA